NRAIYDQLIKKEILFVEDISTRFDEMNYCYIKKTVGDGCQLNELTTNTRFPVFDDISKVTGMITSKDVVGIDDDTLIEKVMTKRPYTVQGHTSLAYVAHLMVWGGIEVIPVVNSTYELEGLVSRQDVLKALNEVQRQPQVG